MTEIEGNPDLVAYCGLYCAACGAHLKGKCPGCQRNEKASWCKVRLCCIEHHYATCAECADHTDPRRCSKFHNLLSSVIGWFLNSDRAACIERIRAVGRDEYAAEMARAGKQRLPRR